MIVMIEMRWVKIWKVLPWFVLPPMARERRKKRK
jgi:hypothetical protein